MMSNKSIIYLKINYNKMKNLTYIINKCMPCFSYIGAGSLAYGISKIIGGYVNKDSNDLAYGLIYFLSGLDLIIAKKTNDLEAKLNASSGSVSGSQDNSSKYSKEDY